MKLQDCAVFTALFSNRKSFLKAGLFLKGMGETYYYYRLSSFYCVSNHSRVLLRIHELEKEASVRKKKKSNKQTDISVPRNMPVHKT